MSEGVEAFHAFSERVHLLDKLPKGGNLQTVIPRILGKGKSRAEGLSEPKAPALVERLFEYARLDLNRLGSEINYPISEDDPIREEQRRAKSHIEDLQQQLERKDGGWEKFAREVLWKLGNKEPGRGGRFIQGEIELRFDKKNLCWSWQLAGVYPLVSKLPHDVEYVCAGYDDAKKRMNEAILPKDEFISKLNLAWEIARHHSSTGTIYIRDVARTYVIAAQAKSFWEKPSKAMFNDVPDAVFVLNLVHAIEEVRRAFELAKASIHQTGLAGKEKDVSYDLPKLGGGGTEPYAVIRRK